MIALPLVQMMTDLLINSAQNLSNTSSGDLENQNPLRIKVAVLNCQSLVGKKALFDFTVCNNLDVIIGSESWLNPSISSSEIFPPKFMVFRKDREDGYGSVFLACTRDFAWQELALQTSCEAVACKTVLNNHQSLIIISIYRPPNRDSIF